MAMLRGNCCSIQLRLRARKQKLRQTDIHRLEREIPMSTLIESGGMVRTQSSVLRLGVWSSLLLAVLAVAAFVLGITTPPRSGPYCTGNCIVYPFTDAARFVPRDYLWVLPAILLAPVFVIVSGCLHSLIQEGKRHLSLIGLCFASIAAGILGIDYFIQFQVAEPSLLRAETSSLSLFTQYNPHVLFIALEDLGYLTLCVSFLFVGLGFPTIWRLSRTIRWTLIVSALLGFACFVGMSWRYGLDIEYRFEVAIITITWITLLALGLMLVFFFRSAQYAGPTHS
jgi:hypothetical protein